MADHGRTHHPWQSCTRWNRQFDRQRQWQQHELVRQPTFVQKRKKKIRKMVEKIYGLLSTAAAYQSLSEPKVKQIKSNKLIGEFTSSGLAMRMLERWRCCDRKWFVRTSNLLFWHYYKNKYKFAAHPNEAVKNKHQLIRFVSISCDANTAESTITRPHDIYRTNEQAKEEKQTIQILIECYHLVNALIRLKWFFFAFGQINNRHWQSYIMAANGDALTSHEKQPCMEMWSRHHTAAIFFGCATSVERKLFADNN